MRVLEFEITNYRSFRAKQTLRIGPGFNVIIGPNGGGKTNLFDALALFLRKVLIAKSTIGPRGIQNGVPQRQTTPHSELSQLPMEKHNEGADEPQVFRIVLEVTSSDVAGMRKIFETRDEMTAYASDIVGWSYEFAKIWTRDSLPAAGHLLDIRLEDGSLIYDTDDERSVAYLAYLQNFENDALLRGERGEYSLAFPLIYLPSHRSREGVSDSIQLSGGQSLHEQKKNTEGTFSKSPNITYQYLAMQKLVTSYRQMVDREGGDRKKFDNLREVRQLTKGLNALGYQWHIELRDLNNNQYDVVLERNGKRTRVDQLSTGESAMLSFIEIVYGLGVSGALILIDEPELHLHPSWQEKVRDILRNLADETGNQIVIATHAPGFVSENTIANVNRVFIRNRESAVQELNSINLPARSKLFRMVNLQNNAKLFFAKNLLLVEGPSDELVVRRLMWRLQISPDELEVVFVGGKGMFASYILLLEALGVSHAIMADRDYLIEAGAEQVKGLFAIDAKAVRDKVLLDPLSKDGNHMVEVISNAVASGDFTQAMTVWEYILHHRLELRIDLSEEEKAIVIKEIDQLAAQNIFILREGEIEDYLPTNVGKDMVRLIDFLERDDFYDQMEPGPRAEIEHIIRRSIQD